jgi:DNA-binding response OmpR family regulator
MIRVENDELFVDNTRMPILPAQSRIMWLLLAAGDGVTVPYAELAAVLSPTAKTRPAKVHISHLRRVLPRGVAIVCENRVGYRLSIRT